jgi:hypothetical protein
LLGIFLKFSPAKWVDQSSGVGTKPGLKKIRKEKTRCNPADPTGWPNDLVDPARPGCNPLIFVCFFNKTTSFWFKKKTIDTGDMVTPSNPETWVLDWASHQTGFKNYDSRHYEAMLNNIAGNNLMELCVYNSIFSMTLTFMISAVDYVINCR